MAVVKHRCDAVEAEAVELKLLKPVLAVREEEVEHVVLAVIKAERVPCRMLVALTRIEELVRVACKISKSFDLVFHSVRVYYIHDDGNTVLMGCVDEFLELLWCAESA